jgi:hypothetical protein
MVDALEVRRLLSTVTVDATQVVRSVNTQIQGVNIDWWDSTLNTSQTASMVEAAGLTAYREPAGSGADTFHFNVGPSYNGQGTAATFAQFIASVNGIGMVTVNYGTGSPQEAAAWLAYLNASPSSTVNIGYGEQWNSTSSTWVQVNWQTAGYWASLRAASPLATDDGLNFLRIGRTAPFNTYYFEVGNEVYGSWETDEHGSGGDTGAPRDPATYIAFAKTFSILANEISPGVSIGVDGDGPDTWMADVLQQCAAQGFTPGFISDHNYMQEPGDESDSFLLQDTVADSASSLSWAARSAGYRSQLTEYLGSAGNNVELLATEFNSVSYDPGKQTTSLVNGLFVADSLGAILETSYDGSYIWDLRNGFDNTNNDSSSLYGWRQGGDYGIIGSSGSAPSTGTYVPYPTYFAEQLVSKIAHSGDTVVAVSGTSSTLSVYAVRQQDGDMDLLVINKSSTSTQSPTLSFTGFQPSGQATFWQYGEAQDTAQSQSTNGSSTLANFTQTLSVNGSSVTISFPAYSMTVVDLGNAALPTGWSDADVGTPTLAGYANNTSGTWTLQAAGSGIGSISDQINFADESANGSFALIADADSISAEAGVMVRADATAGSAFFGVAQLLSSQVVLQYRTADGAASVLTASNVSGATKYFKIIRAGNTFAGYYSTNGTAWTQIGSGVTISMSNPVNAGLWATSKSAGTMGAATFTNVQIVAAPNIVGTNFSAASPSLAVQFSSNVSASLTKSDLTLSNLTAGTTVPSGNISETYNTATNTATFTFPGYANGLLPSGIYSALLTASAIMDASGNPLSGSSAFNFLLVNAAQSLNLSGSGQIYTVQQFVMGAGATLNIGSDSVNVQYAAGADPGSAIQSLLAGGYNAGRWNGIGIISSAAAGDIRGITGVGYLDNGQSINIAAALYGDANLDGLINADDLSLMLTGQAANGTRWQDGNFNYDSIINNDDWSLFTRGAAAANSGETVASEFSKRLVKSSQSRLNLNMPLSQNGLLFPDQDEDSNIQSLLSDSPDIR